MVRMTGGPGGILPVEVFIMAGQSNAMPEVAWQYAAVSGPGVRPVHTWVPGASITAWVTEESAGQFSRSAVYLQKIFDPGEGMAQAEAALRQTPLPSQVSFLWMQGETDTESDESAGACEDRLRALMGFVTEDFGAAPSFTLVMGLIWYVDPESHFDVARVRRIYKVRGIQARVAEEFGALLVDTAAMERRKDNDPALTDAVHLSRPRGASEFGIQLRQSVRTRTGFRPESLTWKDGRLTMRVVHGKRYTLESSRDETSWSQSASFLAEYPASAPVYKFEWTGELPAGKTFFRLAEVPPDASVP